MRALLHTTLTLGLLLLGGSLATAQDKARTKILLIGKDPDHPYGSHMYMHGCKVLAKCLQRTPGVETAVSNGWPKDPATLEGVKTIVLYTDPAAERLLDGPHRAAFEKLMKRGVGLVTIHWASSVRKENLDRLGPAWIGYLGGTWVSNVGISGGAAPLRQLDPKHPICRGWSDHEIDDEYYLNPVLDKKATPLLKVRERGGKDVIVGWAIERPDGGRAFATTLGHPYRNIQAEAFRRMLVNGILWAAHVEVPRRGAPIDVSKDVLALPPKK